MRFVYFYFSPLVHIEWHNWKGFRRQFYCYVSANEQKLSNEKFLIKNANFWSLLFNSIAVLIFTYGGAYVVVAFFFYCLPWMLFETQWTIRAKQRLRNKNIVQQYLMFRNKKNEKFNFSFTSGEKNNEIIKWMA